MDMFLILQCLNKGGRVKAVFGDKFEIKSGSSRDIWHQSLVKLIFKAGMFQTKKGVPRNGSDQYIHKHVGMEHEQRQYHNLCLK